MFEILNKTHDKASFDCGNEPMNAYLKTMANQHAKKGISLTYVLSNADKICAFFSLTVDVLENHSIKGYPNKIPVVLIGRIGVDKTMQGKGLANVMISEAMHQAKQVSQIVGVAFVVIDAKNERLATYYQNHGFLRMGNTLRLIYPINQI